MPRTKNARRAGNQTRKHQKATPILSRTLNRVVVPVEDAQVQQKADPRAERGILPDVVAVLKDNTRLRAENMRLRAEVAVLKATRRD